MRVFHRLLQYSFYRVDVNLAGDRKCTYLICSSLCFVGYVVATTSLVFFSRVTLFETCPRSDHETRRGFLPRCKSIFHLYYHLSTANDWIRQSLPRFTFQANEKSRREAFNFLAGHPLNGPLFYDNILRIIYVFPKKRNYEKSTY